jgi:monoamine oxidase
MIHADILVIGAGASGLIAAKELSAKGKKVIILEARNRAGGRIDTISTKHFSHPAEAGAEFIHGDLELTLKLLKENNIQYSKVEGSMLRKNEGKWQDTDEEIVGWGEMVEKMNALKEDMTLSDFLNTFFDQAKYAKLRQSALQFAQGFDVVNENDASVIELRNEWEHEEEEQYRIPGGYMQLIDALTMTCLRQHCEIHFSEAVNKVIWKKNKAEVTTVNNEQFSAEKIVLTVPISILQSEQAITFIPAIPDKVNAARQIGFGGVIKVLVEFEEAFWQDIQQDALFFFSEEKIPTWWTQYPANSKLLTGWLGGPRSLAMQDYPPGQVLDIALQSLDAIFNKKLPPIKAWHIADWQKEPFTLGAYSYNTIQSKEAKEILKAPVEDTIYFAGEALYTGDAQGTVEAALVSGKEVAERVLNKP